MNYNNKEFIKYLISNTYNIDINTMKNFDILKDECIFYPDEGERVSVSLEVVRNIIKSLKEIGATNKSKQRIGFILESNIIMYFLSSYYIEYRLFTNFVKLLNHNNIGVDIITDENIVYLLPEEIKEMDIQIFFSPNNKKDNPIELNLINSIEDYYIENPTTIRCISDTSIGTEALLNSKLPNSKKLLLLHTQKILNFPTNDNIKDKDDEVFNFIELIQEIDFTIAVTSQELLDKLNTIIPNKDYQLIKELGYTVEDAEQHNYLQTSYQNKNLIIKYTNADDLESCFKAIKSLNNFITILVDDLNDKQLVDYFMNNINYENYKVRESSSYNLLKHNYNIAIDFSNEITVPYECKVLCDLNIEPKDNYIPTDKTNPILIIRNILVNSQMTYANTKNTASFKPKIDIDEDMNKLLKACVI